MWLLDSIIGKIILKAELEGFAIPENKAAFDSSDTGSSGIDILNIVGSTAEITIEGILTNTPNMMALFFGGGNTTYVDIINAIAAAEQNDEVEDIVLSVNSPGGNVAGLFNAIDAIAKAEKPTKAVVTNMATSAAYALVAQADSIVAVNESVQVGSVGIVVTHRIDENAVTITSSKAPKKHPDVTTEKGKAVVQEQLNAFHDIFVNVIARGRNTTIDTVNADFGQGAVLLAEKAKKQGMIDSISNSIISGGNNKPLDISGNPSAQAPVVKVQALGIPVKIEKEDDKKENTNSAKEATMDLKALQLEHPELFAQVVEMGVKQERDRVSAHLIYGGGSEQAMVIAIKAVTDGEEVTEVHRANYTMAATNKNAVVDREGDNPPPLDAGSTATDVDEDMELAQAALKAAGFPVVEVKEGGTA